MIGDQLTSLEAAPFTLTYAKALYNEACCGCSDEAGFEGFDEICCGDLEDLLNES